MRYILAALLCTIALTFSGAKTVMAQQYKTAIFAGGCFWCMEGPFERLDGVTNVLSGYSGGHIENPEYKQVSSGTTGHKEVIEITYDPEKVPYKTLLDIFWRNIDPFDPHGQFCDKGEQYSSAIYASDDEREIAEQSKKEIEELMGRTVATEILPVAPFYSAEDYHQDYYKRNKIRYSYYRGRCGRDKRLKEIWEGDAGGKSFGKNK
jgi:peptide-methionine (S)-S-oxide reductase